MKFQWILASLIVITSLSACSAKVSGGEGAQPPAPQAKPFVDEVTGPSLDGQWKSGCVQNRFNPEHPYLRVTMTIAARNLTRVQSLYTDPQCRGLSTDKTYQGSFRYVLAKGSDIFEVEYLFNGLAMKTGENLRLISDTLYVTNFVSGDAYPDIALYAQPKTQE